MVGFPNKPMGFSPHFSKQEGFLGQTFGSFFFWIIVYGGFLKCWYPTSMGCPTKNDHFGVFWGYHHLRKHPYITEITWRCEVQLCFSNYYIYIYAQISRDQYHMDVSKNRGFFPSKSSILIGSSMI